MGSRSKISTAYSFGQLVRRRRIELGKSLRQLATEIDIDQSTLSKIERDKIMAPLKVIAPLSQALALDARKLQICLQADRIYRDLSGESYGLEVLEVARERLAAAAGSRTDDPGREELLNQLGRFFENHPVEKAWLFGSFARGEEDDKSDIDILVRFEERKNLDLFDYIGIQQELEDLTGRSVDLVEDGQELPSIRNSIFQDRILVYEKSKTSG